MLQVSKSNTHMIKINNVVNPLNLNAIFLMPFKIFMTTPSNVGARCNFSRKTLLAVAVVSAAGAAATAVVVAAYAKGRKKRKTGAGA